MYPISHFRDETKSNLKHRISTKIALLGFPGQLATQIQKASFANGLVEV